MPYSGTLVKAAEETRERVVVRESGEDADAPDYQCASYREQLPDVEMLRAVYGGTKTMRAKGEAFLPRHPMESRKKYDGRRKQAVAYNALRRTVRGLAGMIYRRDPTLSEDMPEEIQQHLEDIDRRGNALPVFARTASEDALVDGHTWIHVEAPRVDGDKVRTRAESRAAGVRPYWIQVSKKDAINWRYEIRAGRAVLTLFVYREGARVAKGDFQERSVSRIRVLREVAPEEIRGELWEEEEGEDGKRRWIQIDEYAIDIPVIPIVPVYGNKTGTFESEPPLQDLAYEQIEHYRVRSDRQKSMTFASIAVPYLFGADVTDDEGNPKVNWGAEGMLLLNDPEAQAGMVESEGHGLSATKEELSEIQARMASLGLQMLVRETRGAETAEAKVLDKAESDAALAVFARGVEDALNAALEIHGMYMRADDTGLVRLNRDYHTQIIDPQFLRNLNEAVAAGNLSLETMWWVLVQGEVLPEDFDPDEERERIQREASMLMEGTAMEVAA